MPNASELRELDIEELENRLTEYRREMLNLRFQLATGQLDNVVRLSVVRKDVARVLTILRDREIALAEGRDASPVPALRPARRRPVEDPEVEDEDEDEDEEVVVRRPRARRTETVDEVSDEVDEVDAAIPDDDAEGDEEDQ
jgi:large subunit ribosomal protein L29